MARPTLVTGYVPIPNHPRTAKEYGELGAKVFGAVASEANIRPFYETVQQTWLYKLVDKRLSKKLPVSHSAGDNSTKNTLDYHCVQHQKFGWLLKAHIENPKADPLVWVDYGIGHVPGVTWRVVNDFIDSVRQDDFAIPGCWPADGTMVNDLWPCWRFCGGLMVVPKKHVATLYMAVKRAVQLHLEQTNNITWEVNTLARIEPFLPPIRWYLADHNASMFTNYGVSPCLSASSPVSVVPSDATSTLQ